VLNCQHHVSWVREVAGGLHQCILCTRVVTKAEVYPKLEDLPLEFQRRWDAWEEKQREAAQAPAPAGEPAPEVIDPGRRTSRPTAETEPGAGPARPAPRGPQGHGAPPRPSPGADPVSHT
jgi:hypothetical protein